MKLTAILKRDMRLFLRELVPALVLAAVLLCACALAYLGMSAGNASGYKPLRVALADEQGGIASKIGIKLIKTRPFVQQVMSIEETDRESAEAGVKSGEFAVAVTLPKGYFDAVSHGVAAEGYVMVSDAQPLYRQIILLLADVGERLVAAGQYGIFSGQKVVRAAEEDYDASMERYLEKANALYLTEAMDTQGKYIITETTDYAGSSVTLAAHYALCFFALFLTLCPLFFTRLCSVDCVRPMLSRLRACGVSNAAFFAGKLLFPALFAGILTAAIAVFAGGKLRMSGELCDVAALSLGVIFSAALGALTLLCFPGARSGVLLIAALSMAGLLMKGGILPLSMLPEAVRAVGGYTPLGVTYAFASASFGGSFGVGHVVAAALWCAAAAFFARRRVNALLSGRAGEE